MNALATASILMLGSGSIHAVVNAIVKGGKDKMAGRAMTDGSSAVILLPVLPFLPLPHGAWEWLAASAVMHAFYLYALIRAYQAGDLSAVYPILRGTAPLVTALVTIGVLHDPVHTHQVAGIAVIGLGMLAMVTGRHLSRPALLWSVATGFTIAGYTVIDAIGVRAAPTPWSYIAWLFVIMGATVVVMFGTISKGAMFAAARLQWKAGAVAGALSILTYGAALIALSLGPTAPLAALRETGMVTALILSAVFLKERVGWGRAAGALGILAGAALILA